MSIDTFQNLVYLTLSVSIKFNTGIQGRRDKCNI